MRNGPCTVKPTRGEASGGEATAHLAHRDVKARVLKLEGALLNTQSLSNIGRNLRSEPALRTKQPSESRTSFAFVMDIATASNIASPLDMCSTLLWRACTRVQRSAARYRQQNPARDATCATCATNATKEMQHAACSMQQALEATCRHAKWKLQRTARSSAHGISHDLSVQHPSAKYNKRNTINYCACTVHVACSSLSVACCIVGT
jgi:hypothetical protein